MENVCDNCPRRQPAPPAPELVVGGEEAKVQFNKDGSLYTAYHLGKSFPIERIEADELARDYPALVNKIAECVGPELSSRHARDILGRLGIRKTLVCPALENEVDMRSGKSISKYFKKHQPSRQQIIIRGR